MLVAFAVTVVVGVLAAFLTMSDRRVRIADELSVAVLMCVSGAVAGWALVESVAGLGSDALEPWDAVGAGAGAVAITALAWRARRREFDELDRAGRPAPRTAR